MAFVPTVGVGSAGSRLRPLATRRPLRSSPSLHPILAPAALGVPPRAPSQAMGAEGSASASPPPPPPPLGRRALLTGLAAAAAGVVAATAAADTLGDPPRASAAPAVGPTVTNAAKDGSTPPETGFVTNSGLRYFDFAVGSGDRRPVWGDLLTVSYVLYTVSPEGDRLDVADSTYARKQHMLVHHGNGQTILGVEEALHGMRAGGRRRVVIPPSLGYTSSGLGPVPPRTTKRRALNKALNEGMDVDGGGGRWELVGDALEAGVSAPGTVVKRFWCNVGRKRRIAAVSIARVRILLFVCRVVCTLAGTDACVCARLSLTLEHLIRRMSCFCADAFSMVGDAFLPPCHALFSSARCLIVHPSCLVLDLSGRQWPRCL